MATISCSLGRIWVRLTPNRTFLVRFGGISGSFGLAVGILARLRLAKIRTKKIRLGIKTIHGSIDTTLLLLITLNNSLDI